MMEVREAKLSYKRILLLIAEGFRKSDIAQSHLGVD